MITSLLEVLGNFSGSNSINQAGTTTVVSSETRAAIVEQAATSTQIADAPAIPTQAIALASTYTAASAAATATATLVATITEVAAATTTTTTTSAVLTVAVGVN